MNTTEIDFLFKRTTCACAKCVQCCHEQPGYLIPSDVARIEAHLKTSIVPYVWNSPGAVVMNTETRVVSRIRTITPRMKDGRCVFLDEHERCSIYPVAPFGCAFFDTHMPNAEGNARSTVGIKQVRDDDDYNALRVKLPLATSYAPRKAS